MDPDLKMIIIAEDDFEKIKQIENVSEKEIEKELENNKDKEKTSLLSEKAKEIEKIISKFNEKEIDAENPPVEKDKQNISNNIFSNLSVSEEIFISFKNSKLELSRDVYRCHLCKELMATKLTKDVETNFINIYYNCPNHHFGSLDITLFLSKIFYFSFVFSKCSKCGEKQENSKNIFYFCKDCEEIYCQKDIKECRTAKENIVSLEDFDYLCIIHKKDYISYCEECNENICEICIDEKHKTHKKYYFKEKVLDKEENDKLEIYIEKGKQTKNALEKEIREIEITFNEYNQDKKEESFLNKKNYICEKIRIYGNLIFYSYCIKKAYDFSFNCNRYNHQIITNLYEIFKNQINFVDKQLSDIHRDILELKRNLLHITIINKEAKLINNAKEGIRIKDQIINNINNNIKINPETFINMSTTGSLVPKINNEIYNDTTTNSTNNNSTSNPTNNNGENKKIIIKKYIFEDGEYEGETRDGLPHGKGTYRFKNGDKYIGEFKNGFFDGKGEHISKKREKYTGQFKKGKREGNGICECINGEKYNGFWKDNKRDGEGKYSFSNGDSYQGEFKEDMFNGKGTMVYSNGNRTIGMWENNKRNGIEFLFNNKGEIFFHFYENNTLIQEKKLDSNQKDFRDFTEEKMNEHMNHFYEKYLKKK